MSGSPDYVVLCVLACLAKMSRRHLSAASTYVVWMPLLQHLRGWLDMQYLAHITGRNWAFSSAVEKLSRHCPGTEYQHKRGHTSNILCRIQKYYPCQRCIKICWDITFQQGEWWRHQMARGTLGDFHINLLSSLSHIWQSQFQQGIVQETIQQFGPTQIVLFGPPGEIGTPKRCVLAIKQSIMELWHLT